MSLSKCLTCDKEARFTCKLCEKVSFCPQCKDEKMFKGHLASDHTDIFIDSNGQIVSVPAYRV